MLPDRRKDAELSLGLDFNAEDDRINKLLEGERQRAQAKRDKREELLHGTTYPLLEQIAKWMDGFYLDGILGFIIPGFGDIISSLTAVPFICFSLFKVRSIPLTLAVTLNCLIDTLVSLVPFVGDICDFFFKANKKNLALITGYVRGDKEIEKQVNQKAIVSAIMIVVLVYIICWLYEKVKLLISAIF